MTSTPIGSKTLIGLLGEWRTDATAYEALADRIRLILIDGRLAAESRLPAERELAERLGVSRTTVAAAYQRLRDLGLAQSVRGSGTVVKLGSAPASDPIGEGLLDLSKAAPPATSLLPDALARAVRDLPAYLGGTGYEAVGLPSLRSAVAARFTQRGLPTDADEILVTTGAQQAINLIARVFLSRGDRVLIESPTYPHAYDAFQAVGARFVTAPVSTETETGWDAAALVAGIRRASPTLAYVMPDFQNPTGRVMPAAVRRQLLDAAAGQGTIVVADETPAELAIDPHIAMQPLASGARGVPVITIGSASKTMWGGLRIGWIRAERSIIRRLLATRANMDLGTPIIEQLTTAYLLERMPEVLAERRAVLAAGRDALVRELTEHFPAWTVPNLAGGLAAWVGIGEPVSSQLALAARSHGLLITAGPRFGIDGAFERFLRFPLTCGPEAMSRAVATLVTAWPEASRHPYGEQGGLSAVV
ncbi:PLP-dependent aminotransferase family protein [Humibacter sp. RRB41]|uniref:MocR-like transcription factor YczR n=1 Tax=Humibacter sp. RRB41 TaxID=2919946 RepID=UPI001FA9CDB2|nr:PLP-dependent aminotransferase family protein [Humibacter sp. RRB41]